MYSSPAVDCRSDEYAQLRTPVILLTALYIAPFPLAMFAALWYKRRLILGRSPRPPRSIVIATRFSSLIRWLVRHDCTRPHGLLLTSSALSIHSDSPAQTTWLARRRPQLRAWFWSSTR